MMITEIWYGKCSKIKMYWYVRREGYSYLWERMDGDQQMVAYAFYMFEEIEKTHFIVLLPERRKNPKRITRGSVLNYMRTILGNGADVDNLFFIEITLDERIDEILRPEPSIRLAQAEA